MKQTIYHVTLEELEHMDAPALLQSYNYYLTKYNELEPTYREQIFDKMEILLEVYGL